MTVAVAQVPAPPPKRRPSPLADPPAIGDRSTVIRCAAVERADGTRFVPADYLLGLMTDQERVRAAIAVETGQLIVADPALDADLRAALERSRRFARCGEVGRYRLAFIRAGRRMLDKDASTDHETGSAAA